MRRKGFTERHITLGKDKRERKRLLLPQRERDMSVLWFISPAGTTVSSKKLKHRGGQPELASGCFLPHDHSIRPHLSFLFCTQLQHWSVKQHRQFRLYTSVQKMTPARKAMLQKQSPFKVWEVGNRKGKSWCSIPSCPCFHSASLPAHGQMVLSDLQCQSKSRVKTLILFF